MAKLVDGVIFRGAGLAGVQLCLWPLLGLYLARPVLTWLAERAAFRGAARVKAALRDRVVRHIQVLGPSYLSGERSGALVECLIKGIEDLENYYARFLPAMALTVMVPLAILVVVLPLDWLSGLVLLVTAPLIPFFMILIGKRAEALNQRQWRGLARMSGRFLDVIQGLPTLKPFNASRREAEAIARVSQDYRHSTMQVLRVAFRSSAVLEFIASLSIAIVAMFIGFRLYRLDLPLPNVLGVPEIGFFTGFFVLLLAPKFFLPLRNLGTHYHGRTQAIAAAERPMEVLDTPVPQGHQGTATLPRGAPLHLRLEGVHFAYAPGRKALRGLSSELQPGARVALVGASGAGKTTAVNLLLGFLHPDAGRILVDELDLATIDPADWRRHLAWVPHNPRLFRGTLLDNIRLGAPDADLDAVCAAARRVRAADFVETLPQGYEFLVGERGQGLPGGQVQRVPLARALLRDAPLVILDEPTASLDPASELLVQEGIDDLPRGRTLLVIAHRLKTVRGADRILVPVAVAVTGLALYAAFLAAFDVGVALLALGMLLVTGVLVRLWTLALGAAPCRRLAETLAYPGSDRPALVGIDLRVPEGGRVAVVGATGSGKSTLFNLLLRFWAPDQGLIRLGGHDLAAFHEEDLRRHIAVVSQHTHLFAATIRDNLLLANPLAPQRTLERACEWARSMSSSPGCPRVTTPGSGRPGYAYRGARRAASRSRGRCSRMPPSSCWTSPRRAWTGQTERFLMAAIDRLMDGRTVLLMTHRTGGLETMDEILVLDSGRVCERGTHRELLAVRDGNLAAGAELCGLSTNFKR